MDAGNDFSQLSGRLYICLIQNISHNGDDFVEFINTES